ncbi:rRNA pseudouridine synthase [Rickettsiales bacterium]|jgi:23S rRNA pseudouridine2605 synthase|nr:rRNA pseudouridine synthase [Rickettsiales bacterium]|tara:strand:+ start:5725 stop:6453 length:729 start_codon:yes stop_codon:yes gene_type:complete
MKINKLPRIAKVIADSGHCSRREAEKLIFEGRVSVNGKIIESPALLISDESIKIDNKLINNKQKTRLWIFHKPAGFLTSSTDPKNRKTIYNILPSDLPRLISIGRLDYNSEGLLLMTTNGELARYVELPKTGWIRKYRVRVHGKINEYRLKNLINGITIDNIKYKFSEVKIEKSNSTNSWLILSLKEGKNREIRKVMEFFGLKVNRLVRISYGPFNLGNLYKGNMREISQKMINNFLPKFID